jgi:hypothetical protein
MIGFGNIQPSIVRKEDGTLVAFMRENGPRREDPPEHLEGRRDDLGAGHRLLLPQPGAGVEAIRLAMATGPWSTTTSNAGGTRWPSRSPTTRGPPGNGPATSNGTSPARVLSLSPRSSRTADGPIHVTYTHGGTPAGSRIQHARFNEAGSAGRPSAR